VIFLHENRQKNDLFLEVVYYLFPKYFENFILKQMLFSGGVSTLLFLRKTVEKRMS
jgi:hypothetical protein